MANDTEKYKLVIDRLLNTYSIDTIISSFHSIDEKIIAIIRFSSEDFIHLNSLFRQFHQEINLISDKALRLFTGFNAQLNHHHAVLINDSVKVLEEKLSLFEKQIEFSRKIHEQILQNLEQIYIPVSNFYQNLNTLKFLSASLKLDPETHGKHGERINTNIEDIFKSYPDFSDNYKKLKKFVGNSFMAIDALKKNYLDNIHLILKFCKSLTDTLLEKQNLGMKFKPVLDDILKHTKESSSIIITNLQYQDIVKQKIEHVKQIHNDIIQKLSDLVEKADQPDYELTRAKLFLQIKEISLLQSAQMVYANREYQQAIEIITSEFLHLSDRIEEIIAMHLSFSSSDKLTNGQSFDADLNIRKEANLYNEIDAVNNIFRLQTEGIIQRIKNFSHSFTLINKTSSDFLNVIDIIRKQHNIKNGHKSTSAIVQISEVAKELYSIVSSIKAILDKNSDLIIILQRKYNEDYLGKDLDAIQKREVKTLSNAFREINYLNREVLLALNSETMINNISAQLRASIESVRYYEHFEKEITPIIDCLNEIYNKMKAGDKTMREKEKDEINTLRKRYTMDSEHRVHDFVMNKKDKGLIDLFNHGKPSAQNEDEDMLEIF
ncbi:MAG: hypothetical protein JXK95_03510 [Bacteroidales bacterium]|nr:hypothetical protein [Bacteroidales bacterium]